MLVKTILAKYKIKNVFVSYEIFSLFSAMLASYLLYNSFYLFSKLVIYYSSNNDSTNNDDKKEFVDQQKDPAIREMLYKISDKHQKSTRCLALKLKLFHILPLFCSKLVKRDQRVESNCYQA